MSGRTAEITRTTRETDIAVKIDLDGKGQCEIQTGIPFMDHMLELLGRHALLDLQVQAHGDVQVDYHHTVEDLGLVLGQALHQALGDHKKITRYGWCLLPMDDALARVALDLGGRPYLVYRIACENLLVRDFNIVLAREFFQALVNEARINLHIDQLYGQEPHHAIEAIFKGVARALRMACALDERQAGLPSTKGRIEGSTP